MLLFVVLVSGSVFADTTADVDARFRADIASVSSEAATAWDRGNAARRIRFEEAIAAYQQAIALAPNVDHPHRRLCGVYVSKGQSEDAVRECEKALAIGPSSPYN